MSFTKYHDPQLRTSTKTYSGTKRTVRIPSRSKPHLPSNPRCLVPRAPGSGWALALPSHAGGLPAGIRSITGHLGAPQHFTQPPSPPHARPVSPPRPWWCCQPPHAGNRTPPQHLLPGEEPVPERLEVDVRVGHDPGVEVDEVQALEPA